MYTARRMLSVSFRGRLSIYLNENCIPDSTGEEYWIWKRIGWGFNLGHPGSNSSTLKIVLKLLFPPPINPTLIANIRTNISLFLTTYSFNYNFLFYSIVRRIEQIHREKKGEPSIANCCDYLVCVLYHWVEP